MTLDEIREILALRDRGERPCDYVREVIRQERTDIDQRIADLGRLRAELIALEAAAEEVPDANAPICHLIDHVRHREPERGRKPRPPTR